MDKNFRGKFVEDQKRATSSINLAALGRSQSVRFLDEMPEQRKTASKGKEKAEEVGSGGNPGEGRAGPSPPLASSEVIEEEDDDNDDDEESESEEEDGDGDDNDMPALPRTKSQLSMLIDKERKYSGSTNLGPEPSRRENRPSQGEGEKDDEDEENELLVMARRDQKGKAKDPDQPFRAAAEKGLLKSSSGFRDDGGEGSKSPPALF